MWGGGEWTCASLPAYCLWGIAGVLLLGCFAPTDGDPCPRGEIVSVRSWTDEGRAEGALPESFGDDRTLEYRPEAEPRTLKVFEDGDEEPLVRVEADLRDGPAELTLDGTTYEVKQVDRCVNCDGSLVIAAGTLGGAKNTRFDLCITER